MAHPPAACFPNAKTGGSAALIFIGLCALLFISFNESDLNFRSSPVILQEKKNPILRQFPNTTGIFTTLEEPELKTWFNLTLPVPPRGVILAPKGGLGNQLFQYACNYALAADLNRTLYLYYIATENPPTRELKPYNREFILDYFHIPITDLIDNTTGLPGRVGNLRDQHLLEKSYYPPDRFNFLRQNGDSYCQSEAYWFHRRERIKEQFRLHLELVNLAPIQRLIDRISRESVESVAVHVRRGDFTYIKGFFTPISFQRRAMRRVAQILEARGSPKPVFFIFSDDIGHAKEKLRDFGEKYELVFVSEAGNSSIQDFYLMMLCKHIIFPNSTFGWWAAYLKENENQDKIVVSSAFNPEFWKLFEFHWDRLFYMRLHGELYHPKEWIIIDPFTGGI